MILHRLTASIRKPDWFNVVLEVLIVVVGIFIGLQVDDWNQHRKDRIEERLYLERLQADLAASIAEIDHQAAALDRRHDQGRQVIRVFELGELGDVSIEAFETGLIEATRVELAIPQQATIDELIATGNLGLIRNPDIRAAIASANGLATRQRTYIALLVQRSNLLSQVIFTRIHRYLPDGEDDLRVRYDLDALMNDHAFQNAIGNAIQALSTNRDWLLRLGAEMRKLQGMVAAEMDGHE